MCERVKGHTPPHPKDINGSLVDPASSHMLVSKIKPCMSKSKLCSHGETADGSLNQSWSKWASSVTWITVVIPELIHATYASMGVRATRFGECVGSTPGQVLLLDQSAGGLDGIALSRVHGFTLEARGQCDAP